MSEAPQRFFLGALQSILPVVHHPERQSHDPSLIALHQLPEGLPVSAAARPGQLPVTSFHGDLPTYF